MRPHRAQSRYPTVMDVLQVEDVDVLNALIEERSIERVLLVEEKKEARAVMREGACPVNAKEVGQSCDDHQLLLTGWGSACCIPSCKWWSSYLISTISPLPCTVLRSSTKSTSSGRITRSL